MQCTKAPDGDLDGDITIKGVVMMYDTLNGYLSKITIPKTTVYLKYAADSTGFIYSATSGQDGSYKFTGINKNKSYAVYTNLDTIGIKRFGQIVYNAGSYSDQPSDTLKVFPAVVNQNVLHVVIVDTLGKTIPNAVAWVFNSKVLFDADTSAGKIFDINTNTYGAGNRFNIPADTYYIRTNIHLGANNYTDEKKVYVGEEGIYTLYLSAHKVTERKNGMELTFLDAWQTPFSGVQVYGYRSKTTFLKDAALTNSLFTITSNGSGVAVNYNIDTAWYYFTASRIVNRDTLRLMDSIYVNSKTAVARKTLQLE